MTKHVRFAKDGALELPAELLAEKGWTLDSDLEVEITADGLTIRAAATQPASRTGFDYEEFRRQVPRYEGPPATIDDMNRAVDEWMVQRWAEKEARSR